MGKEPNKIELGHYLQVNTSFKDITVLTLRVKHTYCLCSGLIFLSL